MEETKLEKLARLSGKVTSKALDALRGRGLTFVVRYLLLSTESLDALPPPKPKMDE